MTKNVTPQDLRSKNRVLILCVAMLVIINK